MSEGRNTKQKSKARQLVSQEKKIQKELDTGEVLNETFSKRILDAQHYPAVYGDKAQWTEPSSKDRDMMIRRQLLTEGNEDNAVTPYGLLTAGPEVFDYLKEKKAQEEYFQNTKMAAFLVDPQRPETQERAFLVAPQLRELPEKQHEKDIAIQEALRVMLRDGFIRGPEDHNLIMQIMKDDYVLPSYPLWDPTGSIISKLSGVDKEKFYKLQKSRAIFNPVRFGLRTTAFPGSADQLTAQRKVKAMILKRLYPGLTNRTTDEIITAIFTENKSPITGEKINNDYVGFTQTIMENSGL